MLNLSVQLPDDLDLDEQSLKEYLAAKLYGDGSLSLGQAASIANTDKWGMPKILCRFGVPYFNYSAEDFKKEYRFPTN
ncbi:MAG TPA: UPF0175 family protein [Candidatus Kapabacteria bacterium]